MTDRSLLSLPSADRNSHPPPPLPLDQASETGHQARFKTLLTFIFLHMFVSIFLPISHINGHCSRPFSYTCLCPFSYTCLCPFSYPFLTSMGIAPVHFLTHVCVHFLTHFSHQWTLLTSIFLHMFVSIFLPISHINVLKHSSCPFSYTFFTFLTFNFLHISHVHFLTHFSRQLFTHFSHSFSYSYLVSTFFFLHISHVHFPAHFSCPFSHVSHVHFVQRLTASKHLTFSGTRISI